MCTERVENVRSVDLYRKKKSFAVQDAIIATAFNTSHTSVESENKMSPRSLYCRQVRYSPGELTRNQQPPTFGFVPIIIIRIFVIFFFLHKERDSFRRNANAASKIIWVARV